MKIRTKATLGMALVALTTTALFSVIIYTQVLRESYTLVDRELNVVAEAVFTSLTSSGKPPAKWHERSSALASRYWLKIFDSEQRPRHLSPLAKRFDLPYLPKKHKYFINAHIPLDALWIDPEDRHELAEITDDKVRFRVKVLHYQHDGETMTAVIAKPLLFFELELFELRAGVAAALAATVLLIFAASYYLAGRVLRPLVTINDEIKEIQERSLDRRIVPGRSRDELFVLSHSLNAMFDRLQHSFRRQKEFVGNAAHELKSPLSILLLGHEEMLAGSPPQPLRRELEKQLHTLRRMARLVSDLLEISRLEQDERLNITRVDLAALLGEALAKFAVLLEARRLEVVTELAEAPLSGDRDKLFRLIVNLLDNAIKYNHRQSGKIRIATDRQQGWVQLSVANTGPQISAADLPRLCEQFFRVEKSRSQEFGGSGLGLTIVNRIVDLHHGSIAFTSDNGWNTCTVRFPERRETPP